ncbi:MAG: hypothetical protein PPP58_00430 [Natronomonas sp.]
MTDESADLDTEGLVEELRRFGGSDSERRAVARQARDLRDSGQYAEDVGTNLTVSLILSELTDAPERATDGGPASRWNWWIGSLEVAYGGYSRFQVRRWRE